MDNFHLKKLYECQCSRYSDGCSFKLENLRTTLGLEKDAVLGTREDAKIKKTHGYKEDHFESKVDTTSLLLEARSWMPTELV